MVKVGDLICKPKESGMDPKMRANKIETVKRPAGWTCMPGPRVHEGIKNSKILAKNGPKKV